MSSIGRDIFRAVHEGKWLSIEYRNKQDKVTHYWIAIHDIDPLRRTMRVRGMHLGSLGIADLNYVNIDSILSASVVDGTYYDASAIRTAVDQNRDFYRSVFGTVPNLSVLDYYEDCNKLDATPYTKEFGLVEGLDASSFVDDVAPLTGGQFKQLVRIFENDSNGKKKGGLGRKLNQLAINVLSIQSRSGLYVLAYRKVQLDVEKRRLATNGEVVFCREFGLANGEVKSRLSLGRYLGEADQHLIADFKSNAEQIKDIVMGNCATGEYVSDMPYLTVIVRECIVDLHSEYDAICKLYNEGNATVPLKAFFGELTNRPQRRKDYPIVLANNKANLDQLLAINKAIKYPLAYVQGPPGTGKTSTIVNTIITALFNSRTVLFCSNNNHPVDGVYNDLRKLTYKGKQIPIPCLRLGNAAVVAKTLEEVRHLYNSIKDVDVFKSTLEKNKDERTEKAKRLTKMLKGYEDLLELRERRESIEKLMEECGEHFNLSIDLSSRQLHDIELLIKQAEEESGTLDEALSLVTSNSDDLMKYFYYTSIGHIKRLGEPKNKDLLDLIMSNEDPSKRATKFNRLISDPDVLKRLLRIFPIIATTCISAHRLGAPEPSFDMTIVDEASQCSIATTLIAVLRGRNLMLVGDPQQLQPVTLLDKSDNDALRKNYEIPDEYDYIEQSAYKVFLGCDAVSDEILLSHHYRCDEKIIDFSNRKYYRGKLNIESGRKSADSLMYVDIPFNHSASKNIAPAEAEEAVRIAKKYPDKEIGIITPFANQREYLSGRLKEQGLSNVACGTVHSFQGDEKDIVLMSLAITDHTTSGTYKWLATNQELINVATSRPKEKLVVLSSQKELDRLNGSADFQDDIYELVQYVKLNGETEVTARNNSSRALGIKPYSTKTESAFLESLNHALRSIFVSNGNRRTIKHEVPIKTVFTKKEPVLDLFYTGAFDFVVYESRGKGEEIPLLAIELDGKEHRTDEEVQRRDAQKNELCEQHGFTLIRVENSYARRYCYIKEILEDYFKHA